MTTVAIAGAGEIGGAAAHALAASDRVGRLLLVDPAAAAAAGKALDIRQAGAIGGFHTRLEGSDDGTRVAGCAACIVADRVGGGEWRGDEGLALLRQLNPCLDRAPVVFAGADQGDLLAIAASELGIERRRLIGSAPEAVASAVRAIVALEANCSPRDVMLAVLGAPSKLVVPWSEASIGGYALQQILSPVQLARVEARVAHLWPPGPSALGVAAAHLVVALLSSARRSFSVLTQLDGEFGVRNRPGCLPARLCPSGIAEARVPELSTRERVHVQTALGA